MLKSATSLLLVGWLWAGLGPSCARGGDSPAEFNQANRLYETGRYAEAAQAYVQLAQRHGYSEALHFNLGNALFKSGQVGRAIHQYRLAERRSPRDPDVQANLAFARRSVTSAAVPAGSRLARWLERLSLDEWSVIAMGALWIWLGLLASGELKPDWKRGLRGYTATSGAVAGLLVLCLAVVVYGRFATAEAIVVAKETEVRYGPLEESKAFYTARDGAELRIVGEKGEWLQVSDASQRVGWVRGRDVQRLPPL